MGRDTGSHCWSFLVGQRQLVCEGGWQREGIPTVCPPGAVIQGDGLAVRRLHGFAHVESRVKL